MAAQGSGEPVISSQQQQQAGTQQQPGARRQDCMGCRMLGAMFGVVGGAYIGSTLLHTPPPVGAHRLGIIFAAGTTFGLGMYRAFF